MQKNTTENTDPWIHDEFVVGTTWMRKTGQLKPKADETCDLWVKGFSQLDLKLSISSKWWFFPMIWKFLQIASSDVRWLGWRSTLLGEV